MKLYHGTPRSFDSFDPNKYIFSYTGEMKMQNGCGVYFTTNKEEAEGYAEDSGFLFETDSDVFKGLFIKSKGNKPNFRLKFPNIIKAAGGWKDIIENFFGDVKSHSAYIKKWITDNREYAKDDIDEFLTLWSEFYAQNEDEFFKVCVDNGISGLEVNVDASWYFEKERKHFVIYDFDILNKNLTRTKMENESTLLDFSSFSKLNESKKRLTRGK